MMGYHSCDYDLWQKEFLKYNELSDEFELIKWEIFSLSGPDLIRCALKEIRNNDSILLLALEKDSQSSNEITVLADTLLSV